MPRDLLGDVPNQEAGQKDLLPDMETVGSYDDKPQAVGGGSSFMAAVEGFNRSYGRMAEGVLQLASPILPNSFNKGLEKHNAREEASYDIAKTNHPVASRVGEFGGYASQALVTPTASGSLAAQTGKLAATGGALGAVQYGDATDRAVAGTMGAAAGAAGGYVMNKMFGGGNASQVKDVGLLQKMINPQKAAARTIANQVVESGDDVAAKGLAAKELGVSLTPGQKLGSSAAAKAETRIPIGSESMREAGSKYLKTQQKQLKAAVDDIVDNIVPGGEKAAREAQKKAYDRLATKMVPDKTQNKLLSNPIIDDELKALNTNKYTTQAVRDLPDTSVLKLDKVKQEIDRSLYKDAALTADPDKAMGAETRRAFQEARRLIVNSLDEAHPEYATTRKLSEKLILKNDLMDEIGKIAPEAGKGSRDISMDQLYQRLWNTPQKQQQFLDRLQSAGGDANHAQNVIEVMNQVRNSPIQSLLEKASPSQKVDVFGNPGGRIAAFMQDLTEGKYNEAYLDMILDNKKWEPAVEKLLNKKSQKTMLMGFKQLLQKINKKFETVTNPNG